MWPALAIVGLVLTLGAGFLFYACAVPSASIFRPVLSHGPSTDRRIALTFDDGPSPYTSQILEILREHKIRATFFLCGLNVSRFPEIAKQIATDGHTLGNHTYSHPALWFRTRDKIAREIDLTQAAIEKVVGEKPRLFRPPFGVRWPGLMGILQGRQLQMVMWSATGYDWKYDAKNIARSATRELHPGAIVLLHDGHATRPVEKVNRAETVKSLPAIIQFAKANGYEFNSVEHFLKN